MTATPQNNLLRSSILKSAEYSGLKLLRVGAFHDVYLVLKRGVKIIVKVSELDVGASLLKNEVRFNEFILNQAHAECGFYIPHSKFIRCSGGALAEFEFFDGNPMGAQNPNTILIEPTNADFKNIVDFSYVLLRASEKMGAFSVLDDQGESLSKQAYCDRIQKSLTVAVHSGLIKSEDREDLLDTFKSIPHEMSLSHHDLMLPNMIKKTDGSLGIIDSEFSRWELYYFDIAYFYLQTCIQFNSMRISNNFLRYVYFNLKDNEERMHFRKLIIAPLIYRLSILSESYSRTEKEGVAIEALVKCLKKNNVDELLGEV